MLKLPTIEPRFFEVYHYADVITAVIENEFDHLQLWDDFFCNDRLEGLLEPYQKSSAFHTFISFMIDRLLYEYTSSLDLDGRKAICRSYSKIPSAIEDIDPFTLPVERALKARQIKFESFVTWLELCGKTFDSCDLDDIEVFVQDLRWQEAYEDLLVQSTREVFFTLFTNRKLLLQFNVIVAHQIGQLPTLELFDEPLRATESLFDHPGVLRREHMPEWVRQAIFFRDRGRCVACHVDLSGTTSLGSRKNFDHIVPLASGGLNDVTNIQLLCETCNLRKSQGEAFTSGAYEDWY